MRISDWSSDVCSSDLLDKPGGDAPEIERVATRNAIGALARHAVWLEEPETRAANLFDPVVTVASAVPVYRLRLQRSDAWRDQQIGRASWRERVGQYV